MRKNLQTKFNPRQYMLSRDFEIYYYSDHNLSKVNQHTHDYYEFYFFIEGDISTQIDDKLYTIRSNDIMLIPPGVSHHPIIHSLDVPYRRFVFWISQDYYRHLVNISPVYSYFVQRVLDSGKYIIPNDQITFNTVQAKALQLIEEMRSKHFGKEAQIPLYVNDLILHLNRIVYDYDHPRRETAETGHLYQALTAYIEEHLSENLSLDELAKQFYSNKYHIAHVFKENLGMSIHQYITKKRLALCRDALLAGAKISEAYLQFGFGDYSCFFRAFKKEYGISPKSFKDMHTMRTRTSKSEGAVSNGSPQ